MHLQKAPLLAWLVAVALILAFACVAQNAWAVPDDRVELDRAITAAQQYWRNHKDPALNDCVLSTRRARIRYGYAEGYNAITYDGGSCRAYVRVDRGYTRSQTSRPRFCRTITHEYGHMLGHHHVSDPSNIMYYKNTRESVPPVCHYQDPHAETRERMTAIEPVGIGGRE